jgi:putative heme-binding domain-containing protein
VEENDPAVRSQLASTAARLPHPLGPALAIAMLRSAGKIDAADSHIPLLLWWAIEAHFGQAKPLLCTELLNDPALWDAPIIRSTILSRFAQRCALDGRSEPLVWCAELLASAPDSECRSQLFLGLDEGLAQITGAELPDELTNIMQRFRAEMPQTDLKLRLRSGDPGAVDEALAAVMSLQTRVSDRIDLISVLGELQTAGAARVCIALLSDASIPVRRAALNAVARFPEPSAGDAIANAYQSSMDDSTGLRPIAIRVMSSRLPWARSLIREIDSLRINAELVTPDLVRQMQSFDDKVLNQSIERLWGTVRESSEEKQNQILALRHQVQTLVGDVERGRKLYNDRCGKCHQLFGEGGQVGPNLTGYERTNFDFLAVAIVDPSAAIREEFTQYQVLTSDGQVIAGLLVGQTPRLLTIRTAENQTVNIQREQVDSFAASPISLMPEGLLEDLSDQQKVDLLSYIAK